MDNRITSKRMDQQGILNFFSGCKDLKVDDYNSKRKEAEKYTSLGCDVDEEKGSKKDTRK